MKNFLLTLTVVITLSLGIFAQANLETIKDETSGYSFKIPENWSGEKANGGVVLVNKAKTANIVVKPHNYKDFDSMIQTEGGIEKDGFTQVGKTSSFAGGAKHFRAYKNANGQAVIVDTIFMVSEYGGGVIVAAISTNEQSAEVGFNGAVEVVKTMSFTKPKQSPQSSNLKSLFSGKKLTYFYTGNGYSESRKIWLCSSGAYISRSESSSNSQIGTGATASSSQGTWTIKEAGTSVFLILNSNKGEFSQFEISKRQASNEIGLNGKRFFVENHNDCN